MSSNVSLHYKCKSFTTPRGRLGFAIKAVGTWKGNKYASIHPMDILKLPEYLEWVHMIDHLLR